MRLIPNISDAAANKHEVAFLWRHDRIIPIHYVDSVISIHQYIAAMNVGMAQHEFRRLVLELLAQAVQRDLPIGELPAYFSS